MQVVYSRLARLDMIDVWEWLAINASISTADAILDRIEQRVASLGRHPEMGPRRADIAEAARVLVVERWLALYAVQAGEVRIVRIVDGAIDLRRIEWPIEGFEE